MSFRVTDPSGLDWTVSREWFGLPRWSRRKVDERYGLESLNAIPELPMVDSVVGVVLAVLALLLLAILWILVLPVLFLAGIIVAASVLLSRLLSREPGIVQAKAEGKASGVACPRATSFCSRCPRRCGWARAWRKPSR